MYDSAVKNVMAGTYGYAAQSAGGSTLGANLTYADILYPFRIAGSLTRIRCRMYRGAALMAKAAFVGKFKCMSGAAAAVTCDIDINVSAHLWEAANALGAAGYFEYDTSATYAGEGPIALGQAVTAVQYLGYFSSATPDTIYCYSYDGTKAIYRSAGDVVGTAAFATPFNTSFCSDVTIQTNSHWPLNDNNGAAGYGKDAWIPLPSYLTERYYIILKKITGIANTHQAKFSFRYTVQATGADAEVAAITIDFGAGVNTITLSTGAKVKTLTSTSGSELDIHVWFDKTNNLISAWIVNYLDGQGTEGDSDIEHICINDRVPQVCNFSAKRLIITQAVGAAVNVASVHCCRKPVLAIGDSFMSQYAGGRTDLAHIGAKMDDVGVFTLQRYVINGGIVGNRVGQTSNGNHTAIIRRWDTVPKKITDADTGIFKFGDMCDYRDVLVVIIGGLNDSTQAATAAQAQYRASQVVGGIGKMLGDALSLGNDIVLCELIPYPDGTAIIQGCLRSINRQLRNLAALAQVPLALVYDGYYIVDASWYVEAIPNRTHPDAVNGEPYIAGKIVDAHENNRIPVSLGSGRHSYNLTKVR